MKKLEGAVDVSNRKIEDESDEGAPSTRDCAARPGIPSRGAVAGHDIDVVGVSEQGDDLAQLELKIGIAEEDEFAACFSQPRAKRRAVAAVGRVMDAANAWVARPTFAMIFAIFMPIRPRS